MNDCYLTSALFALLKVRNQLWVWAGVNLGQRALQFLEHVREYAIKTAVYASKQICLIHRSNICLFFCARLTKNKALEIFKYQCKILIFFSFLKMFLTRFRLMERLRHRTILRCNVVSYNYDSQSWDLKGCSKFCGMQNNLHAGQNGLPKFLHSASGNDRFQNWSSAKIFFVETWRRVK